MRFEFATANRILFGPKVSAEVGGFAGRLGQRALLVTGKDHARAEGILGGLERAGLGCVAFSTVGEPTTEDLERGLALALGENCDLVIGVGGGSALDAAKGIAALLGNGGSPLDYLEVIGRGLPLLKPPVPCIAIPTTAGTGTEVTRNAVILSPEHRLKVSLRGLSLLPALALVDPVLTHTMPPEVTASTGLDALTQLIEPFVSSRATPITDAFCREGLRRISTSLRRAYDDGGDGRAREDMSLAALLSGLALANAGLGSVHGFAGVIGGRFGGPHGAVCAALLPQAMRVNLRAFQQRAPKGEALQRYDEIGRLLTGSASAAAPEAIKWVEETSAVLGIPTLSAYGLSRNDVEAVVAKAAKSTSMKANPIELTGAEMSEILTASI